MNTTHTAKAAGAALGPENDHALIGRAVHGRLIEHVVDEGDGEVTVFLSDGTAQVWTREGIWGHRIPEVTRRAGKSKRQPKLYRALLALFGK